MRARRPPTATVAAVVAAGVSVAGVAPRALRAQTPVAWTARTSAAAVPAGGRVPFVVRARIAPGWHIYSLTQGPGGPFPLRITVPAGQPFTMAGTVAAPAPDVGLDENFKITVETYADVVMFRVPLRAARAVRAGRDTAVVAVRFQACTVTSCLPPQTVTLRAPAGEAARVAGA